MREDTQETLASEEPDRHFSNALSIVDRDDMDYLTRLDMLQAWLARIADGTAVHGNKEDIQSAIVALQWRSKLKLDTPEEQPEITTYGGERTNLRRYAFRRLLERARRFFR